MAAVSTSSLQLDVAPVGRAKEASKASPISAQLTLGGGPVPVMTFDVGVARIGRRSMDLVSVDGHTLEALGRVRFAWISIELDELCIRPLVEIVSASADAASVRYRHLFPMQQRQLDAFNRR